VEYLVRAARVTDIDRLVALGGGDLTDDGDARPLDAADLLRQLVYLPQASIFVAEAQRTVVGEPYWPCARRSARVASSGPSICWSSIPTTMPSA
jgi:hypothetical protein